MIRQNSERCFQNSPWLLWCLGRLLPIQCLDRLQWPWCMLTLWIHLWMLWIFGCELPSTRIGSLSLCKKAWIAWWYYWSFQSDAYLRAFLHRGERLPGRWIFQTVRPHLHSKSYRITLSFFQGFSHWGEGNIQSETKPCIRFHPKWRSWSSQPQSLWSFQWFSYVSPGTFFLWSVLLRDLICGPDRKSLLYEKDQSKH